MNQRINHWRASMMVAAWLGLPGLACAQAAPVKSGEPVEINADQLEVFQQEHRAIFTGNVIAVQGTTRLQADRMVVHYSTEEKRADDPAAPAEDITENSAVERIDVDGNVQISTPEEAATGKRGVYDVPKRQVTLLEDVTLTRGKNILKGQSLVYDFATGKSVINSPQHTPQGTTQGGRVRALFVPEDKKGSKP